MNTLLKCTEVTDIPADDFHKEHVFPEHLKCHFLDSDLIKIHIISKLRSSAGGKVWSEQSLIPSDNIHSQVKTQYVSSTLCHFRRNTTSCIFCDTSATYGTWSTYIPRSFNSQSLSAQHCLFPNLSRSVGRLSCILFTLIYMYHVFIARRRFPL